MTSYTYTVEDRIGTLTNFHDLLNSHFVKAYSWDAGDKKLIRPYSSEIKANFMLVFEPEVPKTTDEKIYAFFRFDRGNPNVAHGVSQFPTDRTYNNDGRRSVPEITVMSFIEHNRETGASNVIFELPAEEQQRLITNSQKKAEFAIIKKEVRQLRSSRTKFIESGTERNRKAYESKLAIFGKSNLYNSDKLKTVLQMLEDEASSSHDEQQKEFIHKEIKYIQSELANREKGLGSQVSSNVTLSVNTRNEDGSMSVKPIMTVEIPNALTKAKAKLEQAVHLISVNISNVFLDIKTAFSKYIANPNKKEPEKKASQVQTPRLETKSAQTVKFDVPDKKHQSEKEPMFSIAKIQSDEYTPTSSKDKDTDKTKTKKNDIHL